MTILLRPRSLWCALITVLALSGFAAAALAQEMQPGSPGTPPMAGTPGAPGLVGIVVKFHDDSVASYRGTIPGLAATSPAVTGAAKIDQAGADVATYRGYLAQQHAAFEAAASAAVPRARVTYRYDTVLNGVAMTVPEDQIAAIAQLPGVKAVYRDVLLPLHTDSSPTFIGARTLWARLGGQDDAGEGVVVGILDTGIWPEHPAFSDPDPKGKPYSAPAKAPAQCDLDAYTCHFKLIGAYRFMASYDACVAAGNCVNPPGAFASARDSNGHGTHTASTAAGNRMVDAVVAGVDRPLISGIAPRAHIVAYKVCGKDGCLASDSVAAIQRAIIDDVDVINFSIGGGKDPFNDVVEMAFLDAYAAGVFVAASAGNDGPTANTVEHRGPWVTTVAASTESRTFTTTVMLVAQDRARLRLTGVSLTEGITTPRQVVVNTDTLCLNSAPPGKFSQKIVVCQRGGTIGRVQKGFNVFAGDAAGMILYNAADNQSVQTDNHWLPAVQMVHANGVALLNFLASHPGPVTATFATSRSTRTQGDVIAEFSSRGGVAAAIGVGKPDITAPGVQILAGMTPAPDDVVEGPPGELFQAIAGTSMSSPHIAGAAALLKHMHPTWTPGQIKSALMTTASTRVLVKEDGETPFEPFDAGSGRVDLTKASAPGVTFDVTSGQYQASANDPWTANYPSVHLPAAAPGVVTVRRTAQSVVTRDTLWRLSVLGAPPELIVQVPASITVPAGGSASFDILIDKRAIPANESRHATLQLRGPTTLHMPISAVGPVAQPDLIVTSVTGTSTGTRGVAMHTTAAIKNQGTATASNFNFQVYLSRDNATLSAGDTPYWFCRFTTVAANGTGGCFFDGAIPTSLAPGTYYLVVRVDDGRVVSEGNENNNVGFFGPITIN